MKKKELLLLVINEKYKSVADGAPLLFLLLPFVVIQGSQFYCE